MTRATGPQRRMRAPARREQLLDVTTEVVVEHGFPAATIEAIAQRAGITRAVIYQHFGDLGTLLETAIDREMTRALSQVSETTPSDLSEGDPRELMLESLQAYLHAVRDHPTTWRLVLLPPVGAPERLRKAIVHGRRSVLAQLTKAVRPGLRGGDDNDAELTNPDRFPPKRLLRHARWWLDQASFGL
jgi:AcrR family transcriptional regulator